MTITPSSQAPPGVVGRVDTVHELLGHADIKMTMRYAHLSPEARREAVALLDLPASGTLAARDGLSAAKVG